MMFNAIDLDFVAVPDLDAVLASQEPSPRQVPSMGRNIKWKPGNEPAY